MSSRGQAKAYHLLLRSNQSWSMVYGFYDEKSPAVMYYYHSWPWAANFNVRKDQVTIYTVHFCGGVTS